MVRRLAPYVIAAAVALTSVLSLAPRPATGAPSQHADYVIIAGAAGLRWDDVNPTDTPTMWHLAEQASIGALSVGSARVPTCPADGWLTLGAGNFAQRTQGRVERDCPEMKVDIRTPDRIGANLPDQETDVATLNRALSYGTQPGALAEAVRCTAAVGPGGAVAGARPYGRVDRYAPTLPQRPEALLSGCVLSIVDLGTIAGNQPAVRRVAARQADRVLAGVLAARPAHSLVLVAGLSDTDLTSRLHVAIADGPGFPAGWLTSPSTSRPGYLQLTDLAPTVLTALDRPMPVKLFTGKPAGSITGRPADLVTAVSRLSDADREAGAQRRVTGGFLTFLAGAELLLFAAVGPFLRRARATSPARWGLAPRTSRTGRATSPARRRLAPRTTRTGRATSPARWGLTPRTTRTGRATSPARRRLTPRTTATVSVPLPAGLVRVLEVLLVAVSLTLPAAQVSAVVPWWRTSQSGLLFGAVTLVVVGALTATVVSGPWRHGALSPLGVVAGMVATIVGIDVLTGARLQLNGVVGYSALEGGRYAGISALGLGLLLTGILLVAGWVAQRVRRRWRPVVMVVVGGVGVVVVGSPYLGANAGGAVALTAGVCLAAAMCTGGFVTFARLTWAVLTGLAVTTGFALLDVVRPPGERGSVGRFLTEAQDGTGVAAIHRTSVANVVNTVHSPLTLVVLGAGLLLMFVLLRPWGGLKRVFGLYPAIRAALIGTAVAGLIAGVLDGAGLMVAGAAAATAVPLACLAALRVLDRADERTPAGSPVTDVAAAVAADVTSDTPPRPADPLDAPPQVPPQAAADPPPQAAADPPPQAAADPPPVVAASPPPATTGDVLA